MKLDRLLGILTVLLQNDRMTAPELAEKFEVNRRTIGRDIDVLCQAGIPIITTQGVGGGISIAEGFKLDKSVLTADELSGIIAALKGIGSVSEQSNVERTLDKLHAGSEAVVSLREPVIIDLASHYRGQLTEKIRIIKQAVKEQRLIEFDYFNDKGDSHRRIEPCFAIFQWSSWYVFGFCLERQDWRMFKLLRLWNLQLCDERYVPRDIPPERRRFGEWLGDKTKLVAIFDLSVKYQLVEVFGLDCYAETDEGLRLEIGFTNRDYIISWLLGFGGMVKVLEPFDVADGIKNAAENIMSNYLCNGCTYRKSHGCKGCIAIEGKPFWGECPVAACCNGKGYTHCGECADMPCDILSEFSCGDGDECDKPKGARIEVCKAWKKRNI